MCNNTTISTHDGRQQTQCHFETRPIRINQFLYVTVTLMAMLILKRYYSTAGADQLVWMLAPVTRLTTWITRTHLVWESGTGYVDFSKGIIIAPACAGINFMIMSFGLAAFCGLIRLQRLLALFLWLILALVSTYTLTLIVNTLRIVLSIHLYQADIYSGWLTLERLHRICGVMLYLSALGLFFKGLQPIIGSYSERFNSPKRPVKAFWPNWLPFAWYLLGAAGVPASHLLFAQAAPGFGEHCLTILGAGLIAWCSTIAIQRLLRSPYHDRKR